MGLFRFTSSIATGGFASPRGKSEKRASAARKSARLQQQQLRLQQEQLRLQHEQLAELKRQDEKR
ncbi:MAG: hypothetical protein ABSG43_30200 [Solirubrobacteraceae bacterium]|jgi:hypothetical protein